MMRVLGSIERPRLLILMSTSRKGCHLSLTAHDQSGIGKQNYKVLSSKKFQKIKMVI